MIHEVIRMGRAFGLLRALIKPFSLVLLLCLPPSVLASQSLYFILDASGSMWGQVEGTPKISVAREVMNKLVGDLPEDSRVGLMAYGHRRKGDCNDIESLVAMGPVDRAAFRQQVGGLNPKGKTPITASVQQAVEQLQELEGGVSIVLVSDGLESCGGDPCHAVATARESGIDFRLHVVGFGLGDSDTAQLQCMAEAGGGRYYSAANAQQLSDAMEEAVQVLPAILLEVTGNGSPLPARAFVSQTGSSDEVRRASIGEQPGEANPNPARIELPAGVYDIRVEPKGLEGVGAQTLTLVTVPEEGEVAHQVDFSYGHIEVTVTANGEAVNARTYVYRGNESSDKEVARYHTDAAGVASYGLSPGNYRIKVHPDGIDAPERYVEDVVVNAGQTTRKAVDYSSGRVELTVTVNGEPLNARTYIQSAETGKEASRDRTNGQGVASYEIPVGHYRIKVHPDGIDAPERYVEDVVVKAGQTSRESIDFAAEP